MVATFFRFCELSAFPDLFYPLYFFALYITVGPWFIGDFVPSDTKGPGKRYGWLMFCGIWLEDGSWEPILDTWVYGMIIPIHCSNNPNSLVRIDVYIISINVLSQLLRLVSSSLVLLQQS